MKTDVAAGAAKITPAVGGAAYANSAQASQLTTVFGLTWGEVAAVATIVYTLVLTAKLLWTWYHEHRAKKGAK